VPARVVELLGPSTGGIRVHVGALADALRDRGWVVRTAAPRGVLAGIDDEAAVVEVPDGWNPGALVAARRQLRALAAGAELVHAHGLKAALVARRCGVPVVLTVHNLVAGGRAIGARRAVAALMGLVERYAIRGCAHVIVISDEIERRVTAIVGEDRSTFVLPIAPTRRAGAPRAAVRASWHDEFGIDRDAPAVVAVARLHPQKDLATLLRAMRLVVDRLPAARAIVAGEGPARSDLEQLRDELGLNRSVHLPGFRSAPLDDLAAADAVALSSRWEGSPLVVAEALSVGAPLVTTPVGTVARHLVDREHARIIPIGDHAAFADALIEVLDHPDAARAMGSRGRDRAAEVFDPDRLVDGVAAVYRGVLDRR
jgi:glycosyltransferase involved in cell wall biosynthesis